MYILGTNIFYPKYNPTWKYSLENMNGTFPDMRVVAHAKGVIHEVYVFLKFILWTLQLLIFNQIFKY